MAEQIKRYIVLPAQGFRSELLSNATLKAVGTEIRIAAHPGRESQAATTIRVVHSTHDDGPKLVEMTAQAELNLNLEIPGLRVIPIIRYVQTKSGPRLDFIPEEPGRCRVRVADAATGRPILGVRIMAFTNFRNREGVEVWTSKQGTADVSLPLGTKLDRLYVFGPAGYWGYFAKGYELSSSNQIRIKAIDLADPALLLRQLYDNLPPDAGRGVTVAIIDSGVAKQHPALRNVTGGVNMVTEELEQEPGAETEWGPAREDGEHGTHVAGIVGMQPTKDARLRGVAPGVSLRSYRVFPNSGGGATNYDVMAAVDRAVRDGCNIINLSLGSAIPDEAVRAAIADALNKGVVVIAAAGNDGRRAVSYPAAWPLSIAVAAMGRKGSFPDESTEALDIARPYGQPDREAFVAAFTNMGPQIVLTGPGVGIVSTLPDSAYGAMSGTSMAGPAVAGFAAHLLSSSPAISRTEGSERSRLLREALCGSGKSFNFGRDYEGYGLPCQ